MLVRSLTCAVALTLVACGSTKSVPQQVVNQNDLMSRSVKASAEWAADVDLAGQPYLAYYDDNRHIYLIDGNDKVDKKAGYDGADERASSGLAVAAIKNQAVFGYRDKWPNRDFFITKFRNNSDTVGMGKESIPLANFVLKRRSDTEVNALWVGEAQVASGANNQVYFARYAQDLNMPVMPAVELFSGIYPVMAQDAEGRVVALSWVKGSNYNAKGRIVLREEGENGVFGPVQEVATVGELTPSFGAVQSGSEVIAYWHHRPETLKLDYKLEGGVYAGAGKWVPFDIKALEGWDFETINVAADGFGNVALVVSAIRPEEKSKSRFQLKLVTSHDGGRTWGEAYDLRRDEVLLKQNYANAKAPHVVFIGREKLVVAWQDMRSLRSAVRYSYSENAGRDWRVEDAWLAGGGTQNIGLAVEKRGIFAQPDGIFLVSEVMQSDRLDKKQILVQKIEVDRLLQTHQNSEISLPDYERLKERATEYWAAMRIKDAEKLYGMIDPFFRARVPFKAYSESLNTVEYGVAELEHEQHIGPVGLVVSKMSVELKPTLMNGKEVKVERAEVNIPTRWMWIDGDWFYEYILESKSLRYATY